MASPTEDQIQAQANSLIWMLYNNDSHLRFNTENFGGHYDDIISGLIGDFASLQASGVDGIRSIASGLADWRSARPVFDAILLDYAKQQNFPETVPEDILDRLFVVFAEGSERVLTRTFTYGGVSAVSGTGDGVVNRLTVERYAYDIENATPETKEIRCTSDRFSGTQIHQEVFEIRGAEPPRDFVGGAVGSQRSGTLQAISADDSQNLIDNPSFATYGGDAPDITSITNWTPTTAIGNFQIELTDVYRTAVHEGAAPGSVRFETNDKLTQDLSVLRPTLSPTVPYYCQIAFKRESSCDGNLTLRLGSNSVTVALSAQSGWTILMLALDENLFFPNFNATTLDMEIELDSRTTGELLVDDIVFAPMTRFDGLWHAIVGGATPFLVDKKFAHTDSVAEASSREIAKNQLWIVRLYDKFLPHDTTASGNITWVEAS